MTSRLRTDRRGLAAAAALLIVSSLVAIAPTTPAVAQTSTAYDFNTAGDLAAYFNGVGPGVASVTQSLTGGLSNSGAIIVPLSSVDAVYSSREGYSIGPVGSTYTFSTFIKSEGNSGYSGVGFTTASPAVASSVTVYRPDNSLGVSVHGGGFEFHNGGTNYSGSWGSENTAPISAVTIAPNDCGDLINNDSPVCGSPSKWYRIVFRIERATINTFDLRVEVWPSDADGSLRYPEATAIFEVNGVQSDHIRDAPQLFAYFNFSGERVTAFDDYRVELGGGATVVPAGAAVVLTEDVALSGSVLSVSGRVAFEGAGAVSERGFVFATSANPTIADTKVALGAGGGSFSGTATLPAPGSYHVRAFATNATTTSYGSATQVTLGGGAGGGGGDAGGVGGAAPSDPMAEVFASLTNASASLSGTQSLLQRGGMILPTTTRIQGGPSSQGSLIIEAPDLRVTLTTTAGVSQQLGLTVLQEGEVLCEICALLAAGTVVEAWVYSEPRLAAALLIESDPEFDCPLLRIPIGAPLDGAGPIPLGAHTLQLRFVTSGGTEALAVPLQVTSRAPVRVSAGEGAAFEALPLRTGVPIAAIIAAIAVATASRRMRVRAGMVER